MTVDTRTIEQAIKDARNNRDVFEDFSEAIKDLEHAIKLLKAQLASNALDAIEREKAVACLADCLGMQGGVLRRKNTGEAYAAALAIYTEGLAQERSLGKDTYNLGNVIAETLIASPNSLSEIQRTLIKEFHDRLKAQSKERDGQWWYHADWALYHLLSGKYGDAETSYERFGNKPRRRDYEAILGVLRRLRAAIEPVDSLIAGQVARAIAFLTPRQPAV